MPQQLEMLCQMNHHLSQLLGDQELDTHEIQLWVAKRAELLEEIAVDINHPDHWVHSHQAEWHAVIQETHFLVEQMQAMTLELEQQLQKYRHGSKSVQQYKKFL